MAVKFETNIPQLLYFPFGDAKEVDGNYGTQYVYTVRHGVDDAGVKDQLYASPGLQEKLRGAAALCPQGTLKGYALQITKREAGTKKFFELCWANGVPVEPLEEQPAPAVTPAPAPVPPAAARPATPPAVVSPPPLPPAAPPPPPARAATGSPPPSHPPGSASATLSSLGNLMAGCIREAMRAWSLAGFETDLPPMDTLHATAATLFIQGCKEGLHRVNNDQPAQRLQRSIPTGSALQEPPPLDDRDEIPFSLAIGLLPALSAGMGALATLHLI